MRTAAVLLAMSALSLSGCNAQTAYYVIEGPSQFRVGSTIYTPDLDVVVEQGGRVFLGPDFPAFYDVPDVPPSGG